MEALICVAPGRLELANLPVPRRDPKNALVRIRCVGICGTDYHIYEGKHPFLHYPRVMGHELAVEVIEAAPEAEVMVGDVCVVNPYISCGNCIACRTGKPNCCVHISVLGVHQDGGMAEFIVVPTQYLIRAQGLTVDECATVEFLAIGAHAVRRASVTDADNVLVVGAGPIGLGVALFARAAGATVSVLDDSQERMSAAQSITGATSIPSDVSRGQAVNQLTSGEGFNVVFDATGNQKAMTAGFDYVAHGGRYVLVGVIKGLVAFSDQNFHSREMTLFGSRNATAEDFDTVIAGIRSGHVPVDRLISHRTSLAGAVQDIPRWATEKSGLIKALIHVG